MARIGNFYWASLFLTGFLAGCGGGGGGGNAWTPIASTEVFQLKTAWDNIVRDTGTRSFTVSGTYAGLALRGSGSITQGGLVGAVFEGVAAQQKLTTVSATITGGGQTVTDTESGSDFYDSNYLPLGTQTADEYTVVNGSATIPQTARVGDTGTAYSDNRYTNSSKTSFLGTNTYTYALQADTASTAIAQIVGVEKDGLGATTYTRTLRYRITPAGAVTPLSETVTDSDGSMVFTYN